jgi:hypothetical protein
MAPTKGHPIPRVTWRGKLQGEEFGRGVLQAMRMLLWIQESPRERADRNVADAIEAMLGLATRHPAKYQEGCRATLAEWLTYARDNEPDALRWTPFVATSVEGKDGRWPTPRSHLLYEHLGRPISVGPNLECRLWGADSYQLLPWPTAPEYLKQTPITRKRFEELRRAQP